MMTLLRRKNAFWYSFWGFTLLALAASAASLLLTALGYMGVVWGEALVGIMMTGALISIVALRRVLAELNETARRCSEELASR